MKLNYLSMIAMLSVSLMCSNLFAKPHLDQYSFLKGHWGSKPLVTKYNKLACTVLKRGSLTYFTIQQKVGGKWEDRCQTITLPYSWDRKGRTHTINVIPGAKYRVFIYAPTPSRGIVSCKGSN